MQNLRIRLVLAILSLVIVVGKPTAAQERTVGLFINEESAFDGYTLLAPHQHPSTYLLDMNGEQVNMWEHEFNVGSTTRLLENGNLLRASRAATGWTSGGGRGGRIEELDWNGDIVWEFEYHDSLYSLHHDILKLENGNVLTTVWDVKNQEELEANGFDLTALTDTVVWTERIVEFKPILPDSAEIVWEWRAWDHLVQDFDATKSNYGVISEHPELIDINTGDGFSWLHFNAIDYNPDFDHIIISSSMFSELWVIDHDLTTEEAAGFDGDLLYRWGNPEMYDLGSPEDRQLFFNHSTDWLEPELADRGTAMIFDNGRDRPDSQYSTVYEFILPFTEDYDGEIFYDMELDGTFSPVEIVWSYSDPGVFYSNFISGQQRLPNGHTLIAEGMKGRIFEVTPEGDIVWEYVNPVVRSGPLAWNEEIPPFSPGNERQQNTVFRAYRYASDYPGLEGQDLTPKGPVERMSTPIEGVDEAPRGFALHQNWPNPFNSSTSISFSIPQRSRVRLTIYNAIGQQVTVLADGLRDPGTHHIRFDARALPSGIYFYRLETDPFSKTRSLLLVR